MAVPRGKRLYNTLLNGMVGGDINAVGEVIAYAIQREIADGEIAGSSELTIFNNILSKYGHLVAAWMNVQCTMSTGAQLHHIGKLVPRVPKRP